MSDRIEKLAKEYAERVRENLTQVCGIPSLQAEREAAQAYKGFRAGAVAGAAEAHTTRRDSDEPSA